MNSSYIILMLLVYNFSKLLFTLIYLFLFIYLFSILYEENTT